MTLAKNLWIASGLLACCLAWPVAGRASSFSVTPVGLTLSQQQQTGVLHVSNKSDTPTVVQLEAKAWTQENGEDVYADTRKLIATPPIFTIPPGGDQVVRVGLRAKPDVKTEQAYRLYLTEVPPAPKPGFLGVRFALRMSLPVFVSPAGNAAPDVHWSATPGAAGKIEVTGVNTGNAHEHINKITIALEGSDKTLAEKTGIYILPGKTEDLTFKPHSALPKGSMLTLTVATDKGTSHVQVPVGK